MQSGSAPSRRVRRLAVALALLVAGWLSSRQGLAPPPARVPEAAPVEAALKAELPPETTDHPFGPWMPEDPRVPELDEAPRSVSCAIDWGGPPPVEARTEAGPAIVFPASLVFRVSGWPSTIRLITRDAWDAPFRERELRLGPDGCVVSGDRSVSVTVVAPGLGEDEYIFVHGCRAMAAVNAQSLTFDLPAPAALPPCDLQADRRRGVLSAPGERVLWTGQSTITLRAPDFAPAGLGVVLSHETLAIEELRPGSPAESAGLQPGDRFVEVDGQDVDGMDVDDFLSWALGPEGSEVSVVVARGEARVPFKIGRAVIE